MEFLGIKFAPLNVPLKRRLETLAVAIWVIFIAFGDFWASLFTVYAIFYSPTLRFFMPLYYLWMYYDCNARNTGSSMRWVRLFRNCTWMRYLSNYFPVKVVKTTDMDPSRNYLFVSFPHGILCFGILAAVHSSNHTGQNKLFSSLEIRLVSLDLHFKMPFFREFVSLMGFIGSDAESISYQLSTKPEQGYTGKVTILVPGGAAESLECRPNTYRIIVKRRKGFVRLALMHGTPLVPVFSFGETNTYDQVYGPEGSLFRRVQDYIRSLISLAPVVLKGRGFFQYNFGILPRRTPITVVVGSPIELPKIEEPTKEQINEYHEKFIKELVNLFETNKHKYIENADSVKLELLS